MLKNGQVDASVNGNVGPALTPPRRTRSSSSRRSSRATRPDRSAAGQRDLQHLRCTEGGKDLAAAYNVVLGELIESGEWLEILRATAFRTTPPSPR